VSSLIDAVSLFLEALWQYIQSPVAQDNIRSMVTSLAFVTSFTTYVLANVVSRKVYIRLQRRAIFVVFFLFSSLVLGIAELAQSISVFDISNFLLKLSFVFWIPGLILLMALLRNTLSVDRISFKKPKASFPLKSRILFSLKKLFINHTLKKPEARLPLQSFQDMGNKSICKFGLICVDEFFQKATHEKPAARLYFPILLIAEKCFRPWRMAARFAVAGLAFGNPKEGLIYFAFNQPADIVIDQLARRFVNLIDPEQDPQQYWKSLNGTKASEKFEQVFVIDCHSKWLAKEARHLHECEFISDFLIYSDPQLALQFIKHNMVWEDRMRISSLYIHIPGVGQAEGPKTVDQNFLQWSAYCVISFKHKEEPEQDIVTIEGLFPKRIVAKVRSTSLSDYEIIKS